MKKLNPLFILVSVFLISCNDADKDIDIKGQSVFATITIDEYKSIAYDNPKEISKEDVINIVRNFSTTRKDILNEANEMTSIKIVSKEFISKDKYASNPMFIDKIPIYTVEVKKNQDTDIAVVSADERFKTILAYYSLENDVKEDNTLEAQELEENVEMLIEIGKYAVLEEIERIYHLQDSLKDTTYESISRQMDISRNKLNFENIKNKLIIKNGTVETKADMINSGNIPGRIVSNHGPLLFTRWNKGMPYNRRLQKVCPDNWLYDERYVVSSPVVATAQVFAFFQTPLNTYGYYTDWPYLTVNPEIHETSDYFGSYVEDPLQRKVAISTVMGYIGEQCQVKYNCSGSTFEFRNFINFIKNRGLEIDNSQSMNLSVITSSLQNIRPILMYGQTSTGGGHVWILDGILGVDNGGIKQYIHANMGYGKSYSGYYLLPSNISQLTFNTGFAHFMKNFQMYPNIRHK